MTCILALGFASPHDVLEAERILLRLRLCVKVIPAPSSLGGDLCGIALQVEAADFERVRDALREAGHPHIESAKLG